MRSIKQYLGQKCLVSGHLDKVRPVGGKVNILLNGCKIEGFDGWEQFEDHMWQSFDAVSFEKNKAYGGWKRLDKIAYPGVVTEYTRKDRTIDYAVEYYEDFYRWSELIHREHHNPLKIIEAIDAGDIYNDYRTLDRDRFLVQLAALRRRLQAQASRPIPTLAKLDFKPPAIRAKKAAGFQPVSEAKKCS
jgi:hypothetical protein